MGQITVLNMMVIILGFWGSIAFALVVTFLALGCSWSIAFFMIYQVGEEIKKGKGEEDSKFFIKITKELFKW